ncbi:MAG: DUF389 domain-containing protein [Dehalococcoidia bacterium]
MRPSTLPAGRLRAEIFRNGKADLRFRLLIWFSCAIATLGLIANSAAVVIGAMLVAPLLGPILALGASSLGGRGKSFGASLLSLAEGAVTSVILSWAISSALTHISIDILSTVPGEITARTRPNPLDLGIALAGGTIGAYAVVRMRDSAALPGVAIATALMPPLCTIGIGLTLHDRGIWGGALLLFSTNLMAIMFSSSAVFWVLGLRPHRSQRPMSGLLFGAIAVGLLGIALTGLTARALREANEANSLRHYSELALDQVIPGSEIVDLTRSKADGGGLEVRLTARTTREPSIDDAAALQALIAQDMQTSIALVLVSVPVVVLDPLQPPAKNARIAIPTPPPGETPTPTPEPTNTPTPTPTASPTFTPSPVPTATSTVIPPPVGNSP